MADKQLSDGQRDTRGLLTGCLHGLILRMSSHTKVFRMLAYFVFQQPDPDGKTHEFVFAISDPAKIETARAIASDPAQARRHVSGTINPTPAWYNPGWSFHLAPESIEFFELAMEVCDANAGWVEQHLDEIGGAALPGRYWCPWSSSLDREVFLSEPS